MRSKTVLGCLVAALLACGAAGAEDGIAVSGRVLTGAGEPLSGGRVTLTPLLPHYERGVLLLSGVLRPDPVGETLTDESGRFRLIAPQAGAWRVRFDMDGYVPLEQVLMPLVEPLHLPTYRVEPAVEVEVLVQDADGEPVAGAFVIAGTVGRPRRARGFSSQRTALTDDRGGARIAKKKDELLRLEAIASGHVASDALETRSTEVRLTMGAGTAVQLLVRDQQRRPLKGALVRLSNEGYPLGLTNGEGLLTTTADPKGERPLRIQVEDGRGTATTLTREAVHSDAPLAITVPPGVETLGRVLDASTREPIARALVAVSSDPATFTHTRADGSFSLIGAEADDLWVLASATNYSRRWAEAAAGTGSEVVIALNPTCAARGTVANSLGEPVEGAEVHAVVQPTRQTVRVTAETLALTDASGSFELRQLAPQIRYRLETRTSGYAPGVLKLMTPEPLQTTTGLEIVLRTGLSLTGTVVDSDGAAVEGARAELQPAPASSSPGDYIVRSRFWDTESDQPATQTDADGRFELLHLASGRFTLEVSAPGFARTLLPGLELDESSGLFDVGEIELPAGARIEGRVTDRKGRAIEGAEVRVQSLSPFDAWRSREDAPIAITDASGEFVITDRNAGDRLHLMIQAAGYTGRSVRGVEAPTLEPLEIELLEAASMSGRVVDESGGPVADARVSVSLRQGNLPGVVRSVSGGESSAKSLSDGTFEIDAVPAGSVVVFARADGFQNAELTHLETTAGEELRDVEIALAKAAVVAGRVTGADGLPVVGAVVMGRQGRSRFAGFAQTDGDGRYRIDDIGLGLQTFVVRAEGLEMLTREIEVQPGENALDFRYEGGVPVSGRVIDVNGEPVPAASVSLSTTSRTLFDSGTDTDATGAFEFDSISPGSYQLRVTAPGHPRYSRPEPVVVADVPVSGITVELAGGGAITGRISGADQNELAEIQIYASGDHGFAMGQASHDGSYRIDRVTAGTWTVRAQVVSTGRQAHGRVTIEEGEIETVLDLELGSGFTLEGRVFRGGEPAEGVAVSAWGVNTEFAGYTLTDHEGRFVLDDVHSGELRLTVTEGPGVLHQETVSIEGDQYVEIALATASVSGIVLDATTLKPLAGVEVQLESLVEPTRRLGGTMPAARTGSQGFFLIPDVPAGEQVLSFERRGYAPRETAVSIQSDLDVENLEVLLSPTAGLTLRATLATGGTPRELWAAVVSPSGAQVTSGHLSPGTDGTFRFSTAPDGEWELLVGTGGAAVTSLRVTVPSPEIPVYLAPGGRLEVDVPDLRESPSEATLRITGTDGRPFRGLGHGTAVETEWPLRLGRAGVDGLTTGDWIVAVSAADGRRWEARAAVRALSTTAVVLGTP